MNAQTAQSPSDETARKPEKLTFHVSKAYKQDSMQAEVGLTGCALAVASVGECMLILENGLKALSVRT